MSLEIRAVCPECDSITLKGRQDAKFYYNPESQLGYCHHCGFKGKFTEEIMDTLNVVDISERLVFNPESYEKLEPLSKEALAYLNARLPGVTAHDLERYGLRYHPAFHAIAIPTINSEGEVQGIKYRAVAANNLFRYSAETGSQFGGYWLAGTSDRLLVVEGELDAISAQLAGFQGTLLALQTNKLSQESINRVRSFKHIFISLDQDKAGTEGLAQLKSLVYPTEIKPIELPEGKDLNEFVQLRGWEECSSFLQSATKTELEKATVSFAGSIQEMLEFLSDKRNTRGTSTGYQSLDSLFGGGFRPQEMTVVNAFAKTGKTSFINNIVHNLAVIGKQVAVASFEMDPARTLYPSLLSIAGQINIRKIADPRDLADAVGILQKDCSYLNNIVTLKRFGYTPWAEVEEWATLMKQQHKIEYLVLDHAGFMVEKMTDAEENQVLAKNIKKLTNTLGIHIFVVVQAPKTKDGLSIQTSYGGLAWGMNADNFVILERSRDNEMELKVKLEAARYPGANPSSTPALLFYDRETCTLTE